MSLVEFLRYATGPGINAIVGFIMSFAAEWVPGFDELSPKAKRALMMLGSFAVPLLATFGLWALEGVPVGSEAWTAIWNALQAGFLAFFTSQAAHARQLK